MILFVFEGESREPAFFRTIEKLYLKSTESIICSYGNNIYNLFKEMSKSDFQMDIVSILQEKWKGKKQNPFAENDKSSDFSEVFLFFDYDCHQQFKSKFLTLNQLNYQLKLMLDFFSNETDNGKLYVNYPMVESIRYTKQLPDPDYFTYEVAIQDTGNFKQLAADFSFYKNLDDICFKVDKDKNLTKNYLDKYEEVARNWKYLVEQNVFKANSICNGENAKPKKKSDVSQIELFQKECDDFVYKKDTVSIVNAFPLFLYDYFINLGF